jgi:hypothetical protein
LFAFVANVTNRCIGDSQFAVLEPAQALAPVMLRIVADLRSGPQVREQRQRTLVATASRR